MGRRTGVPCHHANGSKYFCVDARGPADTADISGVGARRLLGLATFVLTQTATATGQHGDGER